MAKVGIGLRVYNGERFLGHAVESLLRQSHGEFELMIVDDASTDRSPAIAEDLARRDGRIRVHRFARPAGPDACFRHAFERTSGPYFKWALHDDVLEPEFLAECVAALEADPGVVLAFTDADVIDAEGRFVSDYEPDLAKVGARRPSERFRNVILGDHLDLDAYGVVRRADLGRTDLLGGWGGAERNLLASLVLRGRFHRVRRLLFHSRDHAQRPRLTTRITVQALLQRPAEAPIAMPFWRVLWEYFRAVDQAPLSPGERVAAYAALARWLPPNQIRLRGDVQNAWEQVVERLLPAR